MDGDWQAWAVVAAVAMAALSLMRRFFRRGRGCADCAPPRSQARLHQIELPRSECDQGVSDNGARPS